MSTLERTRKPLKPPVRFRNRLLALGAVIASGATALIVGFTGTNHTTTHHTTTHPAIGTQARPHTSPAVAASATPTESSLDPNSWPPLSSALAPLTPQARRYVLGIMALTPAQQAAAYGTGR